MGILSFSYYRSPLRLPLLSWPSFPGGDDWESGDAAFARHKLKLGPSPATSTHQDSGLQL
ncbi:hypothetical protein EJB05_46559 [Eragrostis curvula]|uniref:Uncharacterized protein n=1 Tax=Eragrostis curvula TaxID=38414 RepID=A0A5J9TND0_9POAL|nr:hypothetical protein EJB05_46559 [Eragrostis curvula]